MTSNPDPLVQPLEHAVQHLLPDVTGPEAPAQTASTVELTWCRRLLACGALRRRRFCVTRAARRPAAPVPGPAGTRLTSHDQRATTDESVCGTVRWGRHACTAPGHAGLGPLDAGLSVPAPGSADLRRAWAVSGTPDASYRERQPVLARLWGVSRRRQALETGGAEAGPEVTTCDEPPAASTTPPRVGTILVGQAEGTGGPLGPPPPPPPSGRLGKGQQRPQKQAAIGTGR